MITAEECRELGSINEARINQILSDAEPHIKKTAAEGKNTWTIMSSLVYNAFPSYVTPEPTGLHVKLILKLRALGFSAAYERVAAPYVPVGLSDDHGEGPLYTPWSIVIRW